MPEFKGKFTDLYLKALKVETAKNPPLKEYDLREAHGFGIRVRKTGVITFFYLYHFEGKRKFLNLGIYGLPPDVSLSDARQKHAAFHRSGPVQTHLTRRRLLPRKGQT